ncbi:recombinase RecA [Patescibacteria group bacterium]|nr:recombinase RecA [Patescibacteria group bacterium]MBU1682935.1 recombinase RecA [Patescibacteria group bacterium]MBU1934503.1 recombinase RecA [Patescibacteria group bacterium]
MSKDNKKTDAIKNALTQIEKNFGQGTIMKLGDAGRIKVETIPTSSISLDRALGGGIPKGRVIEIYGPESSGKTTLALHIIAESQKMGGTAAFIDAEHALDPEYAKRIGVNTEDLLISQPDNGEQALEIVETLTRSGGIDVIVIDSVAALTPKAEIEGMMGDSHMGLQARLMSQALRKLTSIIAKTGTTVIFLNQLRMKIGVMFGNPETTTGGNALKFYSSVRLDIRSIDKISGSADDGKEITGRRVRVKVVKNKVAPPFKQAEFDIMFNEGISRAGDLLDTAVEKNLVTKAGAFYTYKTIKIGQGRENAKNFLKDDKTIFTEIHKKLTTGEVEVKEVKEVKKVEKVEK